VERVAARNGDEEAAGSSGQKAYLPTKLRGATEDRAYPACSVPERLLSRSGETHYLRTKSSIVIDGDRAVDRAGDVRSEGHTYVACSERWNAASARVRTSRRNEIVTRGGNTVNGE